MFYNINWFNREKPSFLRNTNFANKPWMVNATAVDNYTDYRYSKNGDGMIEMGIWNEIGEK